jgi:hypothetical protein
LEKSSDFIGMVEIVGVARYDEILPDGGPQGRFVYNEAKGTISSLYSEFYGTNEMTNLSLSETKAEITELRKQGK